MRIKIKLKNEKEYEGDFIGADNECITFNVNDEGWGYGTRFIIRWTEVKRIIFLE